jgi:hypothetical protein
MTFNGLCANFAYYRHARGKIIELKGIQSLLDSDQITVALRKAGGVSVLAVIIILLIIFSLIAMFLSEPEVVIIVLVMLTLFLGIPIGIWWEYNNFKDFRDYLDEREKHKWRDKYL